MADMTSKGPDIEDEARYSVWFVVLTALFVTCLIAANIIAVKPIGVFGRILPAAVIIFPLSYIIGDVITEIYGYREARRVIWLGFAANALVVLAVWAGLHLPAASFWDGQAAYESILGAVPRIVAASFIAYLVGEFTNAYVLARMKIATGGRWLWTRTIGSTVVGQGLDSLVFITVAFAGIWPPEQLVAAVVTQWLVKVAYEALATPLTYLAVGFLKRREGRDAYDRNISFNPLSL
jgi:uncharacterized integral membrane protein (TIGR00697 family)